MKTKASPIIHFQLELEKNIGKNESVRGMLAEWRTKPTVEQLWFDVMGRVEAPYDEEGQTFCSRRYGLME